MNGGKKTPFFKNSEKMKKIFSLIMLLASLATANAKCNWSKVYLAYSNSCNVYKFEVAGTVDTCYQTRTIITNKKTLKKDTFYSRAFGVTFSDTGRYNVFVKVYNKCLGCDTGFEKLIYVTCKPTTKPKCDWSKIGLYTSNKCGKVIFELGSKDTCISKYTLWSYRHKTSKLDTLAHDRVFTRTLDTGWYTFKASFYNKCGNCDTFIYKKIYIGCDSSALGISPLSRNFIKVTPNPANDKVLVCLTYTTKQPSIPYFVYTGSGNLVAAGLISSCVQLNTSSWGDGIYIFKSGSLTQRILIQH